VETDKYSAHYSVLKKECIEHLTKSLDDEKSYIADLTFGAGGHTFTFAELSPNINVISFDQDPDALANGNKRIQDSEFADRITLVDSNFENCATVINERFPEVVSTGGLSGILIDLGVSSHHFDKGERGFSFRFDASLDMRMNHHDDSIKTAADVINSYSAEDLQEIFQNYGEERYSKRIAERIVETRNDKEIKTTKELEDIVFHCYPKKDRFGKTNPSTRVFQALRIYVNRELDVLESVIPTLFPLLKVGGKLAIISFHSLEDRIVKNAFKKIAKEDIFSEIITKRPIVPGEEELKENNRSRSAKLRIIKKISEAEVPPKKLKYRK
jgi:16S rRNA (cytosine1402-N4)-methyltransferase